MSDPIIKRQTTNEMLFYIVSIEKNYLAALVLQLFEEGQLGLDDPLNKWLPDHRSIDKSITIRQLLNHTNGIYDYVKHPGSPFQMAYRSNKTWTQDQILEELVEKPYFSHSDGWHYSTSNKSLEIVKQKVKR